MRKISRLLIVASILLVSCSKTKEIAYDISIRTDRVILGGVTLSKNELLKRVRKDIGEYGSVMPVRIEVAPAVTYGDTVSALRPISDCSLWDYRFWVSSLQPIKITGWTCPIRFAIAKEETVTVDGPTMHTSFGETAIDQLVSRLLQAKSTNNAVLADPPDTDAPQEQA